VQFGILSQQIKWTKFEQKANKGMRRLEGHFKNSRISADVEA
jgi:hypothetical protein